MLPRPMFEMRKYETSWGLDLENAKGSAYI